MPSRDKRHGYYLRFDNPSSYLLPSLSTLLHSPSFLAGPGPLKRTSPSQCCLNRPGGPLLSVQANQPSNLCSPLANALKLPHHILFVPNVVSLLGLLSFLSFPLRLWNSPESFCFAQSESNSFGIGRADSPSTLFVLPWLCSIPLNTTLLSKLYRDVIITFPTASDKWSTPHLLQRHNFTD